MLAERIKVISFDADGTLATTEYSDAIWHSELPRLYAEKNGMGLEEAKRYVFAEYQKIGEHRVEWFDVRYWFHRFELGDHMAVLYSLRHKISYYREVEDVLSALSQRYKLIVASNSPQYYLDLLLQGTTGYFSRIFSATSDYGELKSGRFFLRVCQEMEVSLDEIIHIGDSRDFDLIAPQEAGIRALFLDRSTKGQRYDTVSDLNEFVVKLGLI